MISESTILSALGMLVLERLAGRRFVPRGEVPLWCKSFGVGTIARDLPFEAPEVFPFFELFVADAESTWSGDGPSRLDSGGFTQIVAGGRELHFVATALSVHGTSLLVVAESERMFGEERAMLQRARELRFAHDALSREVEQKEVLAHCVVHDLRNPLSSILGALVLLAKQPLAPSDAKLVEVALRAANRQDELIREILTVFVDESQVDTPRSGETGPEVPHADVSSVVMQIVSVLAPRAKTRRVELVPHFRMARMAHGSDAPAFVVGDELRLFRVVGNLVQNALRYSPTDAAIRIIVDDDATPNFIRVAVEDDGAGVPDALLPRLFHKFASATDGTGGTGLGLYFCRITVERWGGTIGYEPGPHGGSRFWFRLPRWFPAS
ncbi:MAG TPA: HAMP domain-containing sensor histidine kinase [Polyangiaceae bacterium]|nr:HAMP domain-containing sensor histidine kinase [Polyangiaceae bacterium]